MTHQHTEAKNNFP